MGVIHHHGDKDAQGGDEEHHHTIASLRSKFESLAHGGLHPYGSTAAGPARAARPSSRPTSPAVTVPAAGVEAAAVTSGGVGGGSAPPPPRARSPANAPGSATASPAPSSKASPSTSPPRASVSPCRSSNADHKRPPPTSYRPPPPSVPRKPDVLSVASTSIIAPLQSPASSSPLHTVSPADSTAAPKLARAPPPPPPSAPSGISRARSAQEVPRVNIRQATTEPTTAPSAPPGLVDRANDDDDDMPLSVAEVRRRFAQQQAAASSAPPQSSGSRRPSVEALLKLSNTGAQVALAQTPSDLGRIDTTPGAVLGSSPAPSSVPTPSPASLATTPATARGEWLNLDGRLSASRPSSAYASGTNSPGLSRSPSPDAAPIHHSPLSMSPRSESPVIPPEHLPRRSSGCKGSIDAQAVPASIAIPSLSHRHAPPPPPPKLSASPQMAASQLVPSSSTSSLTGRRPAPPRPVSPHSQVPSEAPSPAPVRPPALPARKPTLPNAIPPPLPGNRPILSQSYTLSTTMSDSNIAYKPPLPGNKPAAPSSYAPVEAPALPARSRFNSVSHESGRTGTSPMPWAPARQATTPAHYSPPRQRSRAVSVSAGDDGGIYLPPPPLRSAQPMNGNGVHRSQSVSAAQYARQNGGSGVNTPRRPGSAGDSDDEEGPAPVMTSMAQRLLDEHPDSTYANRRPPIFHPDIKINSPSTITAFATYGRLAAVAYHNVKIYDTQLGHFIMTVDQSLTGLDVRSKEPRITALCFRPAMHPANEGRYLWCGNKDGHLWEVDTMSTDTNGDPDISWIMPNAHTSPITQIMRFKHFVLSLDATGKLIVWEVTDAASSEDEGGNVRQFRNQRISDKVTFAKMVNGRLWTATAPAVRSTTNTAGTRGPTIRVYHPCAPGIVPPALTSLTSEWTGAATSACIVPLKDDTVYVGHEGGFVSLWDLPNEGRELVCRQVLKVSTTDIVALEGVIDHLWAANRRGQIHVWNLDDKPWDTSNIWTAHPDQPIQELLLDYYAIESTGRLPVWSLSRDQLFAWDGLRAVNWIDKRMVERQPDYCDFREVRVLVVSWNIDSSRPGDLKGGPNNTNFLDQVLGSVDAPDIIVFGFQEVVPLTDKKLTAKTFLFGSKKNRDGGGATDERVSGAYGAWANALSAAVRYAAPDGSSYVKVQSEQLVGLFTCMFVKASERDSLRDVTIRTVKRGIGGIYGNKGAIVARMVLDDTSMCFINVHLAAGQKHRAARNADLAAIMEDKAVFPPADKLPYVLGGDGTGILDHEMVVLNGDLNYRIDQRREVVESCITTGDLAHLLEHDQLRREMRGNHAFRLRSFAEAPINFAPTYKYDPGTDEYDTSEKRRIPAWCDRVLFTKSPRIVPLSYRRYEVNVSDHRPVSAGLAVMVKRIDPSRMHDVARDVKKAWDVYEHDRLATVAKVYAAMY